MQYSRSLTASGNGSELIIESADPWLASSLPRIRTVPYRANTSLLCLLSAPSLPPLLSPCLLMLFSSSSPLPSPKPIWSSSSSRLTLQFQLACSKFIRPRITLPGPHSGHSIPFSPQAGLGAFTNCPIGLPLQEIVKDYKRQSLAHFSCLYNSVVFGRS